MSKIILVLGATGAQGIAVVEALLAPAPDGSPSPYTVRALTRNPTNERALKLKAKGVEIFKGNTDDLPSVEAAMRGVYGAWVNIDGFTVGERKEMWSGMRIFELAKKTGVRHYVWSSLDYAFKKGGYDERYRCPHYDAKGRVAEWMKAQPSVVSDTTMSWSVVTTGPYMEMLKIFMFGPLKKRRDGTYVFVSPIGNGHVPMIALADLGYFARYTFDHRLETNAKDLEVASQMVAWNDLMRTFEQVTGKRAEYKPVALEEWFQFFADPHRPVAADGTMGDGSTTWQENFSGWWAMFRDDVAQRNMAWIRSIHPNAYTVERWMRENNYGGGGDRSLLKIVEDGKTVSPDLGRIAKL